MRRAAFKPFVIALLVTVPAFAQETDSDGEKTIDLFEGQNEMSSSAISIEGADGSAIDTSTSGSTARARTDGGITIHYERNGASILVPAKVEGKGVYFLFDTGATYTTLNGAFARRAGIAPKKDYPKMMGQTANGPRTSRVGLINRLELGNRGHYGVTYTVCDACPSGMYRGKPIVGLLGLNVIGRYRTSFDDARGELKMFPTTAYADRNRDVKPWVRLKYGRSITENGTFKFVLRVHNRAPRRIKNLKLRFSCAGGDPVTETVSVSAKGQQKVIGSIPSGKCPTGFQGDVVEARW
jgi:clan AA aspartic protease (TIGR02281 family)